MGKPTYRFTPGELLDAYRRGGDKKQAAKLLKCDPSTFARWFDRAFPEGTPQELSSGPPEGHNVKGVSTLYGPNGEVKAQWIKTQADLSRQREILESVAAELAKDLPRQRPTPPPRLTEAHLSNVYTLTDCHIGMLSWERETGADWDLGIAEQTLTRCFDAMIAAAPPAMHGIVNQLGDFLHFDSLEAVTPKNKHILDSDSRYAKVAQVAVRILRHIINAALRKHQNVTIMVSSGNHDPVGGVWLRTLFAALYEDDKRVFVETSPRTYVAHQFGETMLAFHHGDGAKFDRLPGVFAAEYPIIWGSTKYRYCHTGHYHHRRVLEDAGMVIEQHPTLAARDAYAARLGLHAIRSAHAITYHMKFGEVGRVTVSPDMTRAA